MIRSRIGRNASVLGTCLAMQACMGEQPPNGVEVGDRFVPVPQEFDAGVDTAGEHESPSAVLEVPGQTGQSGLSPEQQQQPGRPFSLDQNSACSVLAPSLMTSPPVDGPLPTFEQVTLAKQPGAAFLHATDLDDDGFPEFLLTTLMERTWLWRLPRTIIGGIIGKPAAPVSPGGAYILRREGGAPVGGDLGEWKVEQAFNRWAGVEWPNESEMFDVDNDGVDDWVIGAGFIARPKGSIVWMKGEQTENGLEFGCVQRLKIPSKHYWYHVAKPVDMDGDGDMDFVTTNHKGAVGDTTSRLEWFENDGIAGKASFTYHRIADGVGGSLVELHDLDGDGDQDILIPQFFHSESLLWYENASGDGENWTRHVIDDTTGRGFAVRVADVNGDGGLDLVYVNHNHQDAAPADERVMGVYWWSIPEPSVIRGLSDWGAYKNTIHEGFMAAGGPEDANAIGAPGMFNVGDIDRDGDLDVSVAGDGDPGLYLFIQQAGGVFDMITLDTGHENSGAQIMADVDGDCDLDIVWAVFGTRDNPTPESHIYAFLQQ